MKFWGADSDRDYAEWVHRYDEPRSPHQPDTDCDCHCDRCYKALELDPVMGRVYARCGDCYGGAEPDGEAFRGGEAAAYEREQMAHIQRTLK